MAMILDPRSASHPLLERAPMRTNFVTNMGGAGRHVALNVHSFLGDSAFFARKTQEFTESRDDELHVGSDGYTNGVADGETDSMDLSLDEDVGRVAQDDTDSMEVYSDEEANETSDEETDSMELDSDDDVTDEETDSVEDALERTMHPPKSFATLGADEHELFGDLLQAIGIGIPQGVGEYAHESHHVVQNKAAQNSQHIQQKTFDHSARNEQANILHQNLNIIENGKDSEERRQQNESNITNRVERIKASDVSNAKDPIDAKVNAEEGKKAKGSNVSHRGKPNDTNATVEVGKAVAGSSSSRSSDKEAAHEAAESSASTSSSDQELSSDDSLAFGLIDEAAALALQPRLIKPLSTYWDKKVDEALAVRDPTAKVTPPPGIRLTRHDIGTVLNPPDSRRDSIPWLNDEVINTFLTHMIERKHQKVHHTTTDAKTGKTTTKTPYLYHAFSSHWFNQMDKYGHGKVRTWGRRSKLQGAAILTARHIFAPVNPVNTHWTLLVISPQERKIEYLDSLGGAGTHAFQVARAWLAAELGELYKPAEWAEVLGRSDRQDNGSDCGVFTVFNALAVVEGFEPAGVVTAAEMPAARRQLVASLVNGGLSGDFDF